LRTHPCGLCRSLFGCLFLGGFGFGGGFRIRQIMEMFSDFLGGSKLN